MNNYCIACDLGGTNITIGLLTYTNNHLSPPCLIEIVHYKSKEFTSVIPALTLALTFFSEKNNFTSCPICISANGPIINNTCIPSNLPESFFLSKKELELEFKSQVILINDFVAISYGVHTILHHKKIFHIPHTPTLNSLYDAEHPNTFRSFLVIGAGTGLGTSQIHVYKDTILTQSGEGGWVDFSPSPDTISYELYKYIASKNIKNNHSQGSVCWEDVISGSKGIPNLCGFLRDFWKNRNDIDSHYFHQLLDSNTVTDVAKQISIDAQTHNNSTAKAILEVWSYLYARCCNVFSVFGLFQAVFIAGGIAAKNLACFTDDYSHAQCLPHNNFAESFAKGYNKKYDTLLKKIPLYVVTDYNISLYGGAFCIAQHMHT